MKKNAGFPLPFFLLFLGFLVSPLTGFSQYPVHKAMEDPYRGDFAVVGEQFALWNGFSYVEVFLKGINMGVSVPGTQPGQLAATAGDYRRWFTLIREAGYNTIRLYTLHYPRFYEELRSFNLSHPEAPILVMQGIWLEENQGARDLFEQSASFNNEIREVVAAVHGEISLGERPGIFMRTFLPGWWVTWLEERSFPRKWP